MSTAAPAEVQQVAAEEEGGLSGFLRARFEALRSGDVGSLPVVIGIVVMAKKS